jgi:pilus assembly protein CpaB
MNRNRVLIGAVVALIIGLLASRYVYKKVQQANVAPQPAMSKVVVAATRLQLGARLRPQDLREISWPSKDSMPGAFANIQDCAGRAAITTIVENEPILEEKLAPREAGAGLPAVIPEGMRALSVRVDDVVSVAGFATPGTMVDVQVTADLSGAGVTRTILEGMRVLAAGQKVEQDKEGKPQTVNVVTLLVDPVQADKLTMASTTGRIHLVLRNTIDLKKTEPPTLYMTSLFGTRPQPQGPGPKRVAPIRLNPPVVVEVIRGDKKESTSFTVQ